MKSAIILLVAALVLAGGLLLAVTLDPGPWEPGSGALWLYERGTPPLRQRPARWLRLLPACPLPGSRRHHAPVPLSSRLPPGGTVPPVVKPLPADLVTMHLDVQALYRAFDDACRAGGASVYRVGPRLGIHLASLSRMKSGRIADVSATTMLRMCAWAGLDPIQFLRQPRATPGPDPYAPSYTPPA